LKENDEKKGCRPGASQEKCPPPAKERATREERDGKRSLVRKEEMVYSLAGPPRKRALAREIGKRRDGRKFLSGRPPRRIAIVAGGKGEIGTTLR